MHQEENYKFFWNVEGNGTIYKEFKLKNTNSIVMLNFYKSPSSLSKGTTCLIFYLFQKQFVPLDTPRKELHIFLECHEQWSTIQRVQIQKHKLNCCV
jgi:hypothetical protein